MTFSYAHMTFLSYMTSSYVRMAFFPCLMTSSCAHVTFFLKHMTFLSHMTFFPSHMTSNCTHITSFQSHMGYIGYPSFKVFPSQHIFLFFLGKTQVGDIQGVLLDIKGTLETLQDFNVCGEQSN